jgi:CRISPR/Cas system-associated exonuclease Cas4 (RecB family)
MGLLPVTIAVKETEFASLYEREDEQSFLDMLNLFYVGTTRAEDALYILSNKLKNLPKENNSVTALLISFLTAIGKWQGFQPYTFGDAAYRKITGKEKKEVFGTYIKKQTKSKNLLASAIKVKVKAEALWSEEANARVDKGRLLHQALKQIRYMGDEVKVVKALVAEGSLLETEQEQFLALLQSVMQHPELSACFMKDVTVINERALLQKGEKMRIPDRVVFLNNSAVVIDYKTGNERPEYKQQVDEYAALLQQAGISVSRKILFYTQTQKAEVWV